MKKKREIYGWEDHGKYFLSSEPYEAGVKPVNMFDTQQEAITSVRERRVSIVWQELPDGG